jgi:hypothetical protein
LNYCLGLYTELLQAQPDMLKKILISP